MNPSQILAGLVPAPRSAALAAVTKSNTVLPVPNGVTRLYLIHEALSRARMRTPQAGRTTSTEASRPARTVAMLARRRAARELGVL
jgi:hypothetical protein